MKQVIKSILLTILMSMVGIKTMAYDIAAKNADGVTVFYNIINGETELEVTVEYENTSGNYSGVVVIPEEVTYMNITRKVTKIGDWAFYECPNLKSITIPNSVTVIGRSAFSDCIGLTSITIPNSVTTIGKEAFRYCDNLESITIGNGVTDIGERAFEGSILVTSITIPNSVITIGEHAFAHCIRLNSVTIPNSVTTIGWGAFYQCMGLSSITIGSQVTRIDAMAFYECNEITKVISMNENPTNIESHAFTETAYNNAILYVPIGSIDKYKSKEGWKEFVSIVEGSSSSISDIESEETNELKRYTLDGRVVNNSHKGINIIQMNNGTTKKVLVR